MAARGVIRERTTIRKPSTRSWMRIDVGDRQDRRRVEEHEIERVPGRPQEGVHPRQSPRSSGRSSDASPAPSRKKPPGSTNRTGTCSSSPFSHSLSPGCRGEAEVARDRRPPEVALDQQDALARFSGQRGGQTRG